MSEFKVGRLKIHRAEQKKEMDTIKKSREAEVMEKEKLYRKFFHGFSI